MNKFITIHTIGCILLINTISAKISNEPNKLLDFVKKHSTEIANHMHRSINNPAQKTTRFNQKTAANFLKKKPFNKNLKNQKTERSSTAEELAFISVKESATNGYVPAQDMLAYCYATGTGTKTNARLAFCWYLKAALGGSSSAKDSLIACFNEGIGVTRDPQICTILKNILT